MGNLAYSELFFLISSIGFIIVFAVIIYLLYFLIKAVKTFNNLVDKLDGEIDNIGDTAKDLVDDIRHSFLYKMAFNPKKRTFLSNKFKQNDK